MAAFLGSTTTSVSRWGSFSYWVSSTRLGSTMIIRTWSGVERMRIDVRAELRKLDLPEPVWPATRRWGILARLTITVRPLMSRPRVASSGWVALAASSDTSRSPTVIIWRRTFGTSTPMACLPGMGARMRTSGVAMA